MSDWPSIIEEARRSGDPERIRAALKQRDDLIADCRACLYTLGGFPVIYPMDLPRSPLWMRALGLAAL